MKDITHIERPQLPWRSEQRLTECKLDAEKHPTWTRDEAIAKAREMGKQRFSLFVCMTCKGTAERHRTWDEDPASCLARYIGATWGVPDEDRRRIVDELRAVALLIDAHRDEFDATVASLSSTTTLMSLRAARRRQSR